MRIPQASTSDWRTIFVTQDQLQSAVAASGFSGFCAHRSANLGAGYLVTYGNNTMQRAARAIDKRRQRAEALRKVDEA